MKAKMLIANKNILINCNQIIYNNYGAKASFTIWLGQDYSSIPKELDDKVKYSKEVNEYYIEPETKFMSIREG